MLMGSPVRLFAGGLFARRYSEQVDRLWLAAGLRFVTGDIPVDSPDVGDGTSYSEVRLPGRRSGWVSSLALSRGTS
jgi:hypothetical protein